MPVSVRIACAAVKGVYVFFFGISEALSLPLEDEQSRKNRVPAAYRPVGFDAAPAHTVVRQCVFLFSCTRNPKLVPPLAPVRPAALAPLRALGSRLANILRS
jgi:hypothetical protein